MSSVSLKKLAIRGAAWTILGYGISNILRLGSNLILTRLLAPELFGLISLVNVFISGLHLFSDIGITQSIIQNKRGDDPNFLNTAWTIQVLRGVAIWLGCIAIAWPLAYLYGEPKLIWLIPIVGLNTLITGFNSTAFYTFRRQLAIDKWILYVLTIQIISSTVMIVWAYLSPTIWALVVGNLVSGLVDLVISHRLIPQFSNRFAWDREAAQDIFSFGRWIFLSTLVTFLGTQFDRIIIAKLLSVKILGIYTIALTFAMLPQQVIGQLASQVMFPAIAKLTDLPRDILRAKILSKRRFILAGVGFIVIFFACFGDLLILKLYDYRYTQAAWMLPILALGVWPNVLSETGYQTLLAVGKPKYQTYGQFLKSLHVLIGLPLGFYFLGLPGLIVMIALNDIELYGVVTYSLWREKLGCFQQDIKTTALLLIILALVLTGRFMLGFGFPISELLASP